MVSRRAVSRRGILAGLTFAFLTASTAGAQAWLSPKGEAWLTLGYGNMFATRHYFGSPDPDGTNSIDRGHMRSQTVGVQVGYGITDRLSASVGIPFVTSKYYGAFPHTFDGVPVPQDDGKYHGFLQDYSIHLGYQLLTGSIAVAPFATAVIPSHSYPTLTHAAPGKRLNEYWLGASAGARLDRILPGSYVEVTYAYVFVDKVKGIDLNLDRSNVGMELGYFVTPSLAVRFLGTGHYTHGGLVFRTPSNLPPDLYAHHDQIGKTSAVNLGGGLSYTLTGSTEVYASYIRTVYGRGGHKIDHALSFGVGWSFSPEQIIRRAFPPRRAGTTGGGH
ncbi:MAG: porin family protein [Acidobacteriota bacterium]|nr:porin family protein [Acidobacteriota bacterium]